MIANGYNVGLTIAEYRKRLAFALQGAYTSHHYSSASLADAIREFVRSARHQGMSLDWVLVAIQNVIDSAIVPPLCDTERLIFSKPILRLAGKAYGDWRDRAAPGDLSDTVKRAGPGTTFAHGRRAGVAPADEVRP